MPVGKTREEYNAHMRRYMSARYYKRRKLVIAQLGGKCVLCGSTDNLEIDHIDSHTKSFSIGIRLASAPESVLIKEIKKCQLLCSSCHTEKSIVDRGHVKARGTHGTLSAYKYCGPPKCEACKKAKRDHTKSYNKLECGRSGGIVIPTHFVIIRCGICNQPFVTRHKKQRFCSRKCSNSCK